MSAAHITAMVIPILDPVMVGPVFMATSPLGGDCDEGAQARAQRDVGRVVKPGKIRRCP